MDVEPIGAEMTVEELLARYPATARAFVRHRMHCVGCDLARFETLAEVCAAYRQPLAPFLAELNQLAGQGGTAHDPSRDAGGRR